MYTHGTIGTIQRGNPRGTLVLIITLQGLLKSKILCTTPGLTSGIQLSSIGIIFTAPTPTLTAPTPHAPPHFFPGYL